MHKGPVIQCAQCGDAVIAPEWSEHRSERCIRNVVVLRGVWMLL
jgi:hypothetical protein